MTKILLRQGNTLSVQTSLFQISNFVNKKRYIFLVRFIEADLLPKPDLMGVLHCEAVGYLRVSFYVSYKFNFSSLHSLGAHWSEILKLTGEHTASGFWLIDETDDRLHRAPESKLKEKCCLTNRKRWTVSSAYSSIFFPPQLAPNMQISFFGMGLRLCAEHWTEPTAVKASPVCCLRCVMSVINSQRSVNPIMPWDWARGCTRQMLLRGLSRLNNTNLSFRARFDLCSETHTHIHTWEGVGSDWLLATWNTLDLTCL